MSELATIRPAGADIEAYRASTEAATICKEIVVATSSNIQGRRYVSVEGWQAIAVAHGCAAGSSHVERVEGGVRAVGEVRRMSDGQLIATAEGFVGEDEPTWYGGQSRNKTLPKRPDYAIRAMAQTRAISRACRSAFAHVVVMMNAGLATTPAEEVPQEGFDAQTGEIIEGGTVERAKVPGIHKIKERLRKFQGEGNEAKSIDTFRALVKANKDDIKVIRDANHEWWTGDGGDEHEGFEKWMARRYAELTPAPEVERSTEYQFLVSCVDECTSKNELDTFVAKHGEAIETLDGEESRLFEQFYEQKEAGLKLAATVSA
jgi:hypothetical protein